ncbi:MAG: sigma-70 family RNA polymerase sigma factor [Bacteroidota bacterium]|jgi:RNA polymerase sigma factor (sigma-70 family)
MTSVEFNDQLIKQRPALRNFALSLTSDAEEAQDLLQDTMLKALVYQDKFAEATNLKAWLYMIMKNTFINSYRRTVKARDILQKTKETSSVQLVKNNSQNTAESVLSEKEIMASIDQLEDEYRIPFMRFYNGFKYKEIADEMDLPIGTVKSRIFLARRKLMDKLKDYRN